MSSFAPERVVFSSIFEALSRVIRADRPELSAEAQALGVDLDRLNPAYPIEAWRKLTALVAQALHPQVTGPVAEYRLGQRLIREYGSTLMGRALLATLRVLGPRRAFSRVSRSFRTANNFTEDRVTQHGPNHFELWLNELDTPYLSQGVLQAALEAAGARNCSVEVIKRDAAGTTYRCQWD
ncbi:MAG: DUF2378 family protein [Myxococcaceae bacterium]|nr:DUF2378 family protein [Myxococcaceae bacterium]MCA3014286.1 DUF2378 family protein [Myxococcaceae bacterium]